jgi:ubiquinone/menaquinone biosynthesis C-methylase UbiE
MTFIGNAPLGPDLRLVGDVSGKRVLDLGCGNGQAAITFAKHGAVVIAVDGSASVLAAARVRAEDEEVRVDWKVSDLADLAFLRADSIDVAFSAAAVGEVADVARLFRQVQRVLRPNSPFVFSHDHPFALVAPGGAARSYFDPGPVTVDRGGQATSVYARTVSEVFTELTRAGFRVDTILEPRPEPASGALPTTIVWRARKEGS